jgi:hypothetical protein
MTVTSAASPTCGGNSGIPPEAEVVLLDVDPPDWEVAVVVVEWLDVLVVDEVDVVDGEVVLPCELTVELVLRLEVVVVVTVEVVKEVEVVWVAEVEELEVVPPPGENSSACALWE